MEEKLYLEMNWLHQTERTASFQKGRNTFLNSIAEFGRQLEKWNFYLYGRKIKRALKCGITGYEAPYRKVYWVIIKHKMYTSWRSEVKKKGKAQFWGTFVRKPLAHSTKYLWSICWNNPSSFLVPYLKRDTWGCPQLIYNGKRFKNKTYEERWK